jgi:hypothetical protein
VIFESGSVERHFLDPRCARTFCDSFADDYGRFNIPTRLNGRA